MFRAKIEFRCRALISRRKRMVEPTISRIGYFDSPGFRGGVLNLQLHHRHAQNTRHTRAHDNVVLRIRQQAHVEQSPRNCGPYCTDWTRTRRKVKEGTRREERTGKGKRRKSMYVLYVLYPRLRGTRWCPEGRAGERPAELWTHSGFLQVVPAGIG